MAKAKLTIETFGTFCASVERRGKILETDIQNAVLLAADYWQAHNNNPRYLTEIYRAVLACRGLSAARLERYIVAHVPVAIAKVKGEVKFVNDDDARAEMGDKKLVAMLQVSWVDFKPEPDENEWDYEKAMLTLIKKCRKEGLEVDKAVAIFDALAHQNEQKLAKAAA